MAKAAVMKAVAMEAAMVEAANRFIHCTERGGRICGAAQSRIVNELQTFESAKRRGGGDEARSRRGGMATEGDDCIRFCTPLTARASGGGSSLSDGGGGGGSSSSSGGGGGGSSCSGGGGWSSVGDEKIHGGPCREALIVHKVVKCDGIVIFGRGLRAGDVRPRPHLQRLSKLLDLEMHRHARPKGGAA